MSGLVAATWYVVEPPQQKPVTPTRSAFTPGRTILSSRFGLYLIDYGLFAYATPAIEQFLIDRTALFYTWVGLFVIVVGRFMTSLTGRVRHDEMPVFDEPAVEMDRLGLWNTVHSGPSLPDNASLRPGPRVADAVEQLAAILHP